MTFSRLTLGEPRLKSKLRGGSVSNEPPCEDPTVGVSISEDWETYVADSGIDYLAYIDSSNTTIQNKSGTQLEEWPHFTQQTSVPGGGEPLNHHWQASTANPHTGSTHIRAVTTQTISVYATQVRSCAEAYWTGRVSEGSVIDISAWFSMDNIPTNWTHSFEIRPVIYDKEHNLCFSQTKLRTLTPVPGTGYNEYTLSTSIPPTEFSAGPPFWMIVLLRQVRTLGTGVETINNDMDEVSITVTP